jgi:cytochrome c oxidase subunit 1
MTGLPRRYYSYANFESFNNFNNLAAFMSVISIIVFLGQILFVVNFFYSIFKGRKLETSNPWDSNSLEWTAPIERVHGNWEGDIPEVYRWPYDYSVNGKAFTPQTVPLKDGEAAH